MAEQQQDISNRDLLLAMHADIKVMIAGHATLTERVDNVADKIDTHIDDDKRKHEALDNRMKASENWRSRVMGMFVVIGAGVAFLSDLVKDAIASAWPWGH